MSALPQPPTRITDELGLTVSNLLDAATGVFTPTLRLGVTGLSRSGKTIFTTALVHNLLTGGRLPGFSPMAGGRLIGAELAEQPDGDIPRFPYEQHLASLTGDTPVWPESTRRISELRLVLKYQSDGLFSGLTGPSQINLDIVDYPGEWLLDLPLLGLSFAEWSEEALMRARLPRSAKEAGSFLQALDGLDVTEVLAEAEGASLAAKFTSYLRESRHDGLGLSTLPPGRFLLPGDLEGSPALTFAPLPAPKGAKARQSLYATFERRFETYKTRIVRPFFRDHFARLDRQIVVVDVLRALNAGPHAVADLENSLTNILACFRVGTVNPLSGLFIRRIDRVLFAASKADHLHSSSHDRLQAILNRLVARASKRARFAGAATRAVAMAAVRATREDVIEEKGEQLHVIIGTPAKGEVIGKTRYDGETEVALFPGDLPEDPDIALDENAPPAGVHFLRFDPPRKLAHLDDGQPILPHIRLDRALEFLIGDRLK